ncbi:MAG: hypothetical protein WA071_10835 [Undibacterium umbellatum]|uniref:hypothetical protein n=1 Tax=Undibacterium umbellatum TaxID=2762300 RepID=UPI003BB4FB9C
MRRQERYAKEGDPGIAAPKGVPVCAVQKMGRPETRYAQTAVLLNPFSVQHKRRLHMGTTKIKNKFKNNPKVKGNPNVNTTSIAILMA